MIGLSFFKSIVAVTLPSNSRGLTEVYGDVAASRFQSQFFEVVKMSVSVIARRSSYLTTTLSRTLNSVNSISRPLSLSNRSLRQSRNPLLRSPSRLRRESMFLSSLLPVHSAIASACLVSKLPNELSSSTEGRFTNYVSPI
ncbi:hypothetical protein LOK49_LG05G00887 [Camellia lanceoleosa]|uniref:Uncharacterized protein n=1 Tax=Camellia lanceoleosa TaxID=1840588 RepID=A0ACC0HTK7_9ERIC|nr:hypothetical protein LOK49_LG05G00887 [Camellia lanceoleosa]